MAAGSEGNNPAVSPANAVPARAARIFVALKVAPEVAEQLAQIARPLERFAVSLIAKEDIHLTLVPPWNEASPADAAEKLRLAIEGRCPFTLEFRHVSYGPDPKRPRLLWAECSATRELTDLQAAVLLAFGERDERPFRPHVTLARIRSNGRRVARKCPIDRDLALTQRIEAVVLMQSPPPGERGYQVVASVPLSN
jgi:2'-5' RNA ligase